MTAEVWKDAKIIVFFFFENSIIVVSKMLKLKNNMLKKITKSQLRQKTVDLIKWHKDSLCTITRFI